MTIEEKKREAFERMLMLKLSSEVIADFLRFGEPRISDGNGLLRLSSSQKEKVHDFEENHDCLVYHVIHTYTNFGEMLALLYVSDYSEEWSQDRADIKEGFPMAYVINLDNDICSEFGTVGVEPYNGGLIRTA